VAVAGMALAALVGGASGALGGGSAEARGEARGLGAALAQRIECAARDLCGVEARGARAGGRAAPDLRFPPPPRRPRGARAFEVFERPPARLGAEGIPRLRHLARAAEGAWLVCLGYRNLRYELDHPRSPKEAMPIRDALEIVNDCLNPWEFFLG
jgi:hypothetical protein